MAWYMYKPGTMITIDGTVRHVCKRALPYWERPLVIALLFFKDGYCTKLSWMPSSCGLKWLTSMICAVNRDFASSLIQLNNTFMGIDRLLIALTGATIRETITFPLVKPLN